MKHILSFLLIVTLLTGLTGCSLNNMEPEEIAGFWDDVVENIGDSQITDDEDLIGERTLIDSADSYVGEYSVECSYITGRDVIFGDASIHNKDLYLSGNIQTEDGTAKIRIRQNNEVTELEPDTAGNFSVTLELLSGGNYIMVVYEDFTGSIEMNCE